MNVRSTDAEFVLLAVDDDGGDLLVHEDENHREQCGRHRGEETPPRVVGERIHDPTAMSRLCRLDTPTPKQSQTSYSALPPSGPVLSPGESL